MYGRPACGTTPGSCPAERRLRPRREPYDPGDDQPRRGGSLGVREHQPAFQLVLQDAVFGGRIFVPGQQLLRLSENRRADKDLRPKGARTQFALPSPSCCGRPAAPISDRQSCNLMRRLVKRRHSDAGRIAALNGRRTGRRHALRRSRFEAQFFAHSGQELVDGVDGFRRHSFAASQGSRRSGTQWRPRYGLEDIRQHVGQARSAGG
jgi:hypothetical protein